jgi:hypothetical protein
MPGKHLLVASLSHADPEASFKPSAFGKRGVDALGPTLYLAFAN